MNRRTFLKRFGIGGAGVAAVGTPAASYGIGIAQGDKHVAGEITKSVQAGQRQGGVKVWWSASTHAKVLALTFDDGPTKQFTASVLDVLARYEVPASFFLIGELVELRPDLVRRAVEAGHEVANHTFDHYSAATQSADETRRTVERGADAIATLTGERPRWFRPVKGHVTGALLSAASEFGHDIALWSVSRDAGIATALDDVDGVRRNYLDDVHPGGVVIFHDGIGRSAFELTGPDSDLLTARTTEITALPDVIEGYLAAGYELVTISELIDLHGRQARG